MSVHYYSDAKALETAMKVLQELDPQLWQEIDLAINRGKDALGETVKKRGTRGRPKVKPEFDWQRQKFTEKEALQLVFNAIQAVCIVAPLAAAAARGEIEKCLINSGRQPSQEMLTGKRESYRSKEEPYVADGLRVELEVDAPEKIYGEMAPSYPFPKIETGVKEQLLIQLDTLGSLLGLEVKDGKPQ